MLDGGDGALAAADRCTLLCNRAAAYAEMDLNRKALNDAIAALAIDGSCLRALLLKGAALEAMGRVEDANRTWRQGATATSGDILLVSELARRCGPQCTAKPATVAPPATRFVPGAHQSPPAPARAPG